MCGVVCFVYLLGFIVRVGGIGVCVFGCLCGVEEVFEEIWGGVGV